MTTDRRPEDAPPLRLVESPPEEEPQDDVPEPSSPGRDLAVPEPAEVEPLTGQVVARWHEPPAARPIFSAWIIDRTERRTAARWYVRYTGHRVVFHGVRTPLYVARLAANSPRGLGRTAWMWFCWVSDREAHALRIGAVSSNDVAAYMTLTRQRNDRVRLRLQTSSGAGATVAVGGFFYGWYWHTGAIPHPFLILDTALFALLMLLGWVGRPIDKTFFAPAVLTGNVAPKLTPSQVIGALGALGIEGIGKALAKGGDGITFAFDIGRDGPGWRADVDLPLGVTAGMVIAKRDRLASGLRRPLGCVWPEGDAAIHEGRLVLWCGDRDLSKTMVKWSLANAASHDVFKQVPFGADPRGRPVSVPLIQHNILIGSLPGNGKTATVRVLACGAALDASVELWLHELKGTGDLDALEVVSHRFVSGIDDESIGYAAESLKVLRAEVMRRTNAIKKLPKDLCPDKRVTRQIADMRHLGLYPLTCVIDECQNLFAHPEYGKDAGEDAEFIIKIGRALGVTLILATQRPDKDSLPTGVSGNVSIRFCLHVAGQTENDMVLGTSAYKNGVRATMFRPEIDAGIGYLKGAGPAPIVVRSAYLDTPATERIAVRARALRQAAGTLSGHALGEDTDDAPRVSLLQDVAAILQPGEERLWNETAVTRLAELRPELYAGWTPAQLTEALKPYGVRTRDTWGKDAAGRDRNRKGFLAKDVQEAISRTAR